MPKQEPVTEAALEAEQHSLKNDETIQVDEHASISASQNNETEKMIETAATEMHYATPAIN